MFCIAQQHHDENVCTDSSTLYRQNPELEIVQQSVKVDLQMYNGNVQQNPLRRRSILCH